MRDLARRLQSGLARHGDVEDREVDVARDRPVDRRVAVVRLGDHREVGLGVEHQSQSAQHDRMVVRDKDAGS